MPEIDTILSGSAGSTSSVQFYGMIGAIIAAVITGVVALYLRWKNQRLDDQKIELERQKLAWEKEKMRLQLAHETAVVDRKKAEDEQRASRAAERKRQLQAQRSGNLQDREAGYRTKLRHELSRLKILDMTRPLNLDQIYVQVQIRERQPLRYSDEAELRPPSGTRRTGGPDEAMVSSPPGFRGGAPVVLAPAEALRQYHRIVVVGDPGAGKTTMLKHLASQMLPDPDRLPIYIELRRFVDDGCTSLIDYAVNLLDGRYGFAISRTDLDARLESGRVALLLDGLDEILGERHSGSADAVYDAVSDEVNRVATRFPDCPIVVTCRVHGWREGLPTFRTLEALDFSRPQMERFIHSWFRDRPQKGTDLLHVLEKNQRLQGLAGNPLLLSLIAIVYEKDLELPERRAALYRRCVHVLLSEWDSHRRIKRLSYFTTDRKSDLLKHIAWTYHRAGRRYFETDDLLLTIAEFLPKVDIDPAKNRAILDEIAAQYGLLKEQAHGWYGFLHLTLQEYFAASALLERGQDGIDLLLDERANSWWEEVILLFAGGTADAGPLLRGILGLTDDQTRSVPLRLPHDDIFHRDLYLAARCLAAVPRIGDASLRAEIAASVRAIAVSAENPAEAKRAAVIFAEATGWPRTEEDLGAIIDDDRVPLANRVSIIESLGDSRRIDVAEWILFRVTMRRADKSWTALVRALGTLRWPPAHQVLLNMVQPAGENGDSPDGSETELRRAAAQCAGDLTTLITDWKCQAALLRRVTLFPVKRAYVDSIVAAVDSEHADDLLGLIGSDDEFVFDRRAFAGTYLTHSGRNGLPRLLALAVDSAWSPMVAIPILAAIAADSRTGFGDDADLVAPLVAIAQDDDAPRALSWFAARCLERVDPRSLSDRSFIERSMSGDPRDLRTVSMSLLALAWGDESQLDSLRRAARSGLPGLSHDTGNIVFNFSSNLWERLYSALAPYDREWVVRVISENLSEGYSRLGSWYWFQDHASMLFLLDPDAALRCIERLLVDNPEEVDISNGFVPITMEAASAARAIRVLETILDRFNDLGRESALSGTALPGALLASVTAVANDVETVRSLHQLLVKYPRAGSLYEALHDLAQKLHVRVLPSGEIAETAAGGSVTRAERVAPKQTDRRSRSRRRAR